MEARGKTKLESILLNDATLSGLLDYHVQADVSKEIQARLDELAPTACDEAGDDALVEQVRVVYDETAPVYAQNPDHAFVPNVLLDFMRLPQLKDGDTIVDAGCGDGRDARFLAMAPAFRTPHYRQGLIPPPEISFHAIGLDMSAQMIVAAYKKADPTVEGAYGPPSFMQSDIFVNTPRVCKEGSKIFYTSAQGIWSSAALFMHTPRSGVSVAFKAAFDILTPGGVLGVSYCWEKSDERYHNLRASRTGRIKYFSRPTPQFIATTAKAAGFSLYQQQFEHLYIGDVIKENFFCVQFFEKLVKLKF